MCDNMILTKTKRQQGKIPAVGIESINSYYNFNPRIRKYTTIS